MSRREKLSADLGEAAAWASAEDGGGGLLTGFVHDAEDDTVAVRFESEDGSHSEGFTLHVADYPEMMMFVESNPGEPVMLSGETLLALAKRLHKEQMSAARASWSAKRGGKAEEDEEDEELGDEDEEDEDGEYYEDEDEDGEEDYDMDDDVSGADSDALSEAWEEEYAAETAYTEHENLSVELTNHRAIFGEETVVTRPMPLLEAVEVDIRLDVTEVIDNTTCDAWGVSTKLPVTVRLTFSSDHYTDSTDVPKIEFFQLKGRDKKPFKLQFQLEHITKAWLAQAWPGKGKTRLVPQPYDPATADAEATGGAAAAAAKAGRAQLTKSGSIVTTKAGDKGWLSRLFGARGTEAKTAAAVAAAAEEEEPLDAAKDSVVAQLMEMGFDLEMCRSAARQTDTLEAATHLLLTSPEKCKPGAAPRSSSSSSSSSGGGGRGRSSGGKKGAKTEVNKLFDDPGAAMKADAPKVLDIPPTFGFLVMLQCFLRARLPTLNNYCVICDQPHVFSTGNMLKPAVCSRELCCFGFQQMGVAGDAADDIATAAEVVDLLVSLATLAANHARHDLILSPYPTVFDPHNSKVKVFDPEKKNIEKVRACLSAFPSVQAMTGAKDFADMKTQMDRAHPHAFNLLQWIITSNRSHLVKLDEDKLIKSMDTPHQYLLLSAPPEKEARFRELKAKYGSVWAFHGSSAENWHSILRNGLKNASGTKLQVNGAAYGSGIYLAPQASTSFGYCRMYNSSASGRSSSSRHGGNRFLNAQGALNLIAICEVINHDIKKSGGIWVHPHEDHVVTRYFCCYVTTDTSKAQQSNCENASFVRELENAMK